MADILPAAGLGHNSGELDLSLALDPAQLRIDLTADAAALAARCTELAAAFTRFDNATAAGIPDEPTLVKAGDFVRQLAALSTAIDGRRTVVKKPVLEAQRIIDAFYKAGMSDPIDGLKAKVLAKITAFQRAVQARLDEARREEMARQRAAAEALARAAEQAAPADTGHLMDRAVEAEEQAATLAAAPVRAPAARSDMGTTVSTRKGPWKLRVLDIAKVPAHFLQVNEAMLLAFAKTDATVAGGAQPVAGVEFYREETAIVR